VWYLEFTLDCISSGNLNKYFIFPQFGPRFWSAGLHFSDYVRANSDRNSDTKPTKIKLYNLEQK